jgi:hypothetical protein
MHRFGRPRGLPANLPSQTANRIHPERNIGLSLLLAEAIWPRHSSGRTRAPKSQSRFIEAHSGVQSFTDTVGTSEAPRIPWCRDPRRKRLHDLFARLYDFIVLLSGGLCCFSVHSLPGLGAQKENSSGVENSDRFDSGRRRVSSRGNAEPSEVAWFRRFRVRIC